MIGLPPQTRVRGLGRHTNNKLFEFVFDSVYVNLQYDEISITFTAGSVSLCLWSSLVCL